MSAVTMSLDLAPESICDHVVQETHYSTSGILAHVPNAIPFQTSGLSVNMTMEMYGSTMALIMLMNGIMEQSQPVTLVVNCEILVYLSEAGSELSVLDMLAVVVALDENLVTAQRSQYSHCFINTAKGHVPQYVDRVPKLHRLIPGPDHLRVHVISVCVGTSLWTESQDA